MKNLEKRTKIQLVAFVVDIVITVVLILITVLTDDQKLSIGGRIALLSANIVTVIAALQLSIGMLFDDQKDEIDKVNEVINKKFDEQKIVINDVSLRLEESLVEMETLVNLEETYIKIFKLDERMKILYRKSLDSFLNKISKCIEEKRSGELDIMTYYQVLHNLADEIIIDKQNNTEDYRGGIWALTFCLDDEWDETNPQERNWFDKMKNMDNFGINTTRLWVFDKKVMAPLMKEPIDDEGKKFLQRFKLYCTDDPDYKNTTSHAISKEHIIDDHVRVFGKGFFAATFHSGNSKLIRGVCFDNLFTSNTLGGEIDFDEIRINDIKTKWNTYIELASFESLKDYLIHNSGESAREYMGMLGFFEPEETNL